MTGGPTAQTTWTSPTSRPRGEPVETEDETSTVRARPVDDDLGQELADDRGVLEAVPAEPVRQQEPGEPGDGPDDRVAVGGHLVQADPAVGDRRLLERRQDPDRRRQELARRRTGRRPASRTSVAGPGRPCPSAPLRPRDGSRSSTPRPPPASGAPGAPANGPVTSTTRGTGSIGRPTPGGRGETRRPTARRRRSRPRRRPVRRRSRRRRPTVRRSTLNPVTARRVRMSAPARRAAVAYPRVRPDGSAIPSWAQKVAPMTPSSAIPGTTPPASVAVSSWTSTPRLALDLGRGPVLGPQVLVADRNR